MGAASDGKPPAAPPCSTDVDDFIDLFPKRRCPCADFTDERDGGFWTISLYGVRFDTFFFYSSLSLYSRYRIHSIENPLDLTLDDLYDLNNGIRARSSRARSCERKMNRVNPNPNETLTLTLISNRQRTEKNTARSKDREWEKGKGMGGGSPELDRRPPVARVTLTLEKERGR